MFESPSSSHMALDYLLAALDVGIAHFTICDIRHSRGVNFETGKTTNLHYCLEGCGTLVVQGTTVIELEPHTFVLLPPGLAYCVKSASSPSLNLDHFSRLRGASPCASVSTLTVGEGPQGIAAAYVELCVKSAGGSDIFASFREPLVVRFDGTTGLQDQFVMLQAESTRPRMGSRVLTESLIKQCLILALRRRIEFDSTPLPWRLAGVTDARLGRALRAIFDQPANAYTVDGLAMIAGMSRSAFAAAFRRAFDQSPMSFVKFVRLRRATELLITTTLPVAEVAKRVGFSSRANFSVAFGECHGMDPSRYRRTFSMVAKKN